MESDENNRTQPILPAIGKRKLTFRPRQGGKKSLYFQIYAWSEQPFA